MTDHAIEPMPRPNPVAPPGRICGTCRFWRGSFYSWFGDCEEVAAVLQADETATATPRGFGCNHWRGKGEPAQ